VLVEDDPQQAKLARVAFSLGPRVRAVLDPQAMLAKIAWMPRFAAVPLARPSPADLADVLRQVVAASHRR
jgi:hypothetical protein